jgi:transposase-like protein
MIIHLDPDKISNACKQYGIKNYCTDAWITEYRQNVDVLTRSKRVSEINKSLEKTQKAVVVLGDSYSTGQGAYDQDLLDTVMPIRDDTTGTSAWDYKKKSHEPVELLKASEQFFCAYTDNFLETGQMELSNCYLSQMHQMSDESFTPINLAHAGHANNASIERIFRYPIKWELCKEVTVIWCYTDIARYSVPQQKGSQYDIIYGDYKGIWMSSKPPAGGSEKEQFHYLFTKNVWSEETCAWRFLQEANTLKQWIKQFAKSKLVVFPAFHSVTPESLQKDIIADKIPTSDKDWQIYNINTLYPEDYIDDLNGYHTFLNFCLESEDITQEEITEYVKAGGGFGRTYRQFQGGWVTPCGHPGKKGHRSLAEHLIKKGVLTDYE